MITKEQAILAGAHDSIFHEASECTFKHVVRWRTNGKCRLWKRDPERWELPIIFGLYSYGVLSNVNAHEYHLEQDCPVDKQLLNPILCGRHGGIWGDDPTCVRCTYENGVTRPQPPDRANLFNLLNQTSTCLAKEGVWGRGAWPWVE